MALGLLGNPEIDSLVADDAAGVVNARKHVLAIEPRMRAKQIIDRVTRGQHSEYALNGQAGGVG